MLVDQIGAVQPWAPTDAGVGSSDFAESPAFARPGVVLQMIINRNEPGQRRAGTLASLLGGDLPVAIRAYDGSYAGPSAASATVVIRPVHVRSSAQRRGSTTRVSRRYGY